MTEWAVPQQRALTDRLRRPIGRRELLLWIAGSLFANQIAQLLDFSSVAAFATSFAYQNYVAWFACFVVLKRISESRDIRVAAPDVFFAAGVAMAILVASVVPYRFAVGLLTTLSALYLLMDRHEDRSLKAAGFVMLALSAHLVWGPILFQLMTPELLSADAALVGGLLKLVRPDIVWTGTTFQSSSGFAVSLVGACSSFHNLSTALLACAAASMFMRDDWRKTDVVRMVIAGVAMIVINDIRICLLASGPDSHAFWHDGAGATLLGFATTIVLLAIAFASQSGRNARA